MSVQEKWCENVNGSPLGKGILLNNFTFVGTHTGFVAVWAFQHVFIEYVEIQTHLRPFWVKLFSAVTAGKGMLALGNGCEIDEYQ